MIDASDSDIRLLVAAIVGGDTAQVRGLLGRNPDLARATLPGNPRSMLHYATDWPANRPNVAESIALLVQAGADPNVAMPTDDSPDGGETPLHWAVSANDVAATEALLDAGAPVDSLGGIFGGCTPLEEAIIFEQYDAARLLVERGATNYLPGAAALGEADLVEDFFDVDGKVRTDIGRLPHWESMPTAEILLDRAFQFACRAGHLEIAKRLLGRGANLKALTPVDTTAQTEADNNGHSHVVDWLKSL